MMEPIRDQIRSVAGEDRGVGRSMALLLAPESLMFDQYTIRPLTIHDLMPYFELVQRNRERLADFFTGTVSKTQTVSDTGAFLLDITARAEARTYFPFLIIDTKCDGKFAGFLDLKNIDWSIPKAEIGCYIDKDYAGKGIATQALDVFCNHCFQKLLFRKLFLRTHSTNTAAQRLAESAGFQQEGVLRWDYKTTAGALVDLIYYGRLNG